MSRWRRSVDELAARHRQQGECERAQDALSRVTSCFQQLATSLGSSADGSFLRDEMDETRALAHRICSGLSRRLLRLLSESDSAPSGVEDRQVSERLWVLFLSALDNFLSDLRKASDLIGQFPLTQRCDRRSLVNAGQLLLPTSCLWELCDWPTHFSFVPFFPHFLPSENVILEVPEFQDFQEVVAFSCSLRTQKHSSDIRPSKTRCPHGSPDPVRGQNE
uniref:Regulator of G protein signaling 9 binding protein n=1 Tax=Amphiprion ocellaris TaxID=80972 RepID=A0AAQ5ZGF3_AMPOC